mgnify:CR=1 FL=1
MRDNGLLRFAEKTREELIEDILQREKQLTEKDKRIRELEKKLRDKEKAEARLRELKFSRLKKKKKRSHKPGQKPGF